MSIEEIQATFSSWEENLTTKQKRYIHFYSMRNFAYYFNELPSEEIKGNVGYILEEYIMEVKENWFNYTAKSSYELVDKYMNKISDIYKERLGFRTFLKLRFVFIFGVLGDGILYIFLHDQLGFYFPIVFSVLMIYYLYTKLMFERKKKVYGLYY